MKLRGKVLDILIDFKVAVETAEGEIDFDKPVDQLEALYKEEMAKVIGEIEDKVNEVLVKDTMRAYGGHLISTQKLLDILKRKKANL